jgi:exonuclease SbcC
MSPRLKFLTVEDFRSIRGPIGVSLDAPVVLIHGSNGTGKTSLLSAIELALIGSVPSLARFDDEYLAHLPHKLARDGQARICLQADGVDDSGEADLVTDGAKIVGAALLNPYSARFYTERCYLAQATLGRLLEIYEQQDNRKSDTPLTRFVKEMLGLEALDALIEGLHAAGNVRRFREVAPLFWAARADAPKLDESVNLAQEQERDLRDKVGKTEAKLRELARPLIPAGDPIQAEALRPSLARLAADGETRLTALARIRRDISGASAQVREALISDAGGERLRAEQANVVAREALTNWQSGPGLELEAIISAVQANFPDVPPTSSDPAASHAAALAAVKAARVRIQALANADDADARALSDVRVAIRQGQGRIQQIDQELASAHGANRELAEALTAIASHIEDEHCPVCGRDFSDISSTPLAAHVSEEVARLVTAAGRVEALVRDRSSTAASVIEVQRREADLQSRRLSAERRDSLKSELAKFSEWVNGLDALAEVAATGSQFIRDATQSAQALSVLNSRQSSISGLRAELASHAEQLSLQPSPEDVPLQNIVDGVMREVERQTVRESALKASHEQALQTLAVLADVRSSLEDAEARLAELVAQQQQSASRRAEAERRILVARDLVSRAQAVRGDEVRRVFNEELNTVWRDLFIRLAPDEAFVPAFAVPEVAGGPVEAVLETHYRSGGKGGNPRSMLSAGNLNTAALTLFLALHLSVRPVLPWLVVDDPVQSMDDVHIAQFAALLRTLKQHGRQVIIAVHDRQLFEYLVLELSPAFNGDRLVTIELGRNANGMTTAPWNPTVFEPDRAIAA